MKILVFCPYYPPHTGGLESHSDEFNRHISARGVEITVFTPRLPKNAPESETRHNGVKILRFPALELFHNYPVPKFWLASFWRQWDSLFKEDCDIVISRTRFFFPTLMALRYARKQNIPLLHIEHGSDFAKFNSRVKTKLGELYDFTFGRFILRYADSVIGNSQASADFVKKLSRRTNCQVIYRGANIEEIASIEPWRDLQEKYQGKTIIAFIGRLIDGKGVRDLITTVAELKRNDIVTLTIGDGPEKEHLEKLVSKYQLENQIILFGNLPFNNAISVLKTADIVVNPSYTEGLPTSVTEAALCRKAIIATNVGGTREIISGDNDGYLIKPKNTAQLKEKLLDLIDHPEKRLAFGQNAYRKVVEKFSWSRATDQYLEVFSQLLNNRKK